MDQKPACKYGASCYRKNPEHLRSYSHPERKDQSQREPREGTPPPPKRQKRVSEELDPLPANDVPSCSSAEVQTDDTLLQTSSDESDDFKTTIRKKFLVELPSDFYHFWDFCSSLKPENPSAALRIALGLDLVGPYDVLAGRLKGVPSEKAVLHFRHFYDPPEMTTVLSSVGGSEGNGGRRGKDVTGKGFHIGYFRDCPHSGQFLVVSNDSEKNCELAIEGSDIFSAVRYHIECKQESGRSYTGPVKTLDTKLKGYMSRLKLTGVPVKELKKRRSKEVVAQTFNTLGIVVPYDKKADLGYRPLPLNNKDLLKLLKKISSCNEAEKEKVFEPLQEIITFVQFANDECDYGMGLELGMDLFCHGDVWLHRVLKHLLPLAYELLGREEYAKICRCHLDLRQKLPMSFCKS